MMNNFFITSFVLVACFCVVWTRASVVSTGDFNRDFFVTWSPNHVKTSADGRNRSLILDKDSGTMSIFLPKLCVCVSQLFY